MRKSTRAFAGKYQSLRFLKLSILSVCSPFEVLVLVVGRDTPPVALCPCSDTDPSGLSTAGSSLLSPVAAMLSGSSSKATGPRPAPAAARLFTAAQRELSVRRARLADSLKLMSNVQLAAVRAG